MDRKQYPVLAALGSALALLAAGCTPSSTLVRPDHLAPCDPDAPAPESLRVVSYNMHGGMSSSLDTIAAVLQDLDADVIALEEVDRGVGRSGLVDQDQVLADELGYETAFAAARRREDGDFGVAILSRLPFSRAERIDLHEPLASQPRVALDTSVCVGPDPVRVVAVHTDVWPWASKAATDDLVDALGGSIGHGVILAGDLNVIPSSAGPRALEKAGLVDLIGRFGEQITFRELGARRIDYIFADAPLADRAGGAGVEQTDASDHYPVYSDFSLEDLASALTPSDATATR